MQSINVQETQKNGATKTPARAQQETRVVTPAVDVLDNGNEVLVLADLPGVRAEDMNLHLDKETLTLVAQRKAFAFDRPLTYKRTFSVPNDLDPEGIEAKLDAGVLTLRFPRRASAKPRTIPVKTR